MFPDAVGCSILPRPALPGYTVGPNVASASKVGPVVLQTVIGVCQCMGTLRNTHCGAGQTLCARNRLGVAGVTHRIGRLAGRPSRKVTLIHPTYPDLLLPL